MTSHYQPTLCQFHCEQGNFTKEQDWLILLPSCNDTEFYREFEIWFVREYPDKQYMPTKSCVIEFFERQNKLGWARSIQGSAWKLNGRHGAAQYLKRNCLNRFVRMEIEKIRSRRDVKNVKAAKHRNVMTQLRGAFDNEVPGEVILI